MSLRPPLYLCFVLLAIPVILLSCTSGSRTAAPEPEIAHLAAHLFVWEDSSGKATAASALSQLPVFRPLQHFPLQNKTGIYWLTAPLPAIAGPVGTSVLSFSNLTYVDIYIYKAGRCVLHKQAGAFRKRSQLARGDGRFWASLPAGLPADSCTLLLKVEHTKHYVPRFDFTVQDSYDFFRRQQQDEAMELRLQGVLWIFVLYTLLCWFATRNSTYGWLLLTIAAVTFYNLCPSGYFIAWFFPEAPAIGWLFNIHFVHVGMIGLYMLTVNFWQVRAQSPRLYLGSMIAVWSIAVFSGISFIINYFTGNFAFMNFLNLGSYALHIGFAAVVVVRFWPRLDPTQKYLAYGILMFVASCLFVSVRIIVLREQAFVNITYMSSIMIISIFFMLFAGLAKSQQRTEKEKQLALEKLNRLQEHQKTLLEEKVKQQTAELNNNNARLTLKNRALAERNQKIAILINELNHRVKNNLQLLYSLISLQLPGIKDRASRDILTSNINRIKAMILVNRRFFHLEELQLVNLEDLTREMAANIKQIYDTQRPVLIRTDFDEGIQLSSRKALYFSLVISELLTNSFKYAFAHVSTGLIQISAIKMKGVIVCRYSDNGTGPQRPHANSSSIGLSLVKDLVRQMNGQLSEYTAPGLAYELTFPIDL
ncbi:histidine kinase dimerization/phosphoacceptor domain -containing protein [Chitinophaga alhagiae]|uniref:histidine kinase dimerization/phosphoacceptor domain -containing protein n=1 Tax=Chitinophaga alhagiae TaxID=2203219 RepID=UPI000E5A6E2A|nr:histidine kinase dimerization/phosphoacceptor domain -containing protein [Chitinophaga alhagiae]